MLLCELDRLAKFIAGGRSFGQAKKDVRGLGQIEPISLMPRLESGSYCEDARLAIPLNDLAGEISSQGYPALTDLENREEFVTTEQFSSLSSAEMELWLVAIAAQ